ncbi:MAG: hypothetical protein JW909_08415 [Planctomycetes bacterium]|nr:hypothetical protein [Planctomycetota bacterium]
MTARRTLAATLSAAFIITAAQAMEFSLSGSGATLKLHRGGHIPGGGTVRAEKFEVGSGRAMTLGEVAAVLGLRDGKVHLGAASAGMENREELLLHGGVTALFSATPPAGGKARVPVAYARVSADRGSYGKNGITLGGSVHVQLGNSKDALLTAGGDRLSHRPDTGILLSGSPVSVTVAAGPDKNRYTLAATSVRIRQVGGSVYSVDVYGPGAFETTVPVAASGTYERANIIILEQEGTFAFEEAILRGARCRHRDTEITADEAHFDRGGNIRFTPSVLAAAAAAVPVVLTKGTYSVTAGTLDIRRAGGEPENGIAIFSPGAAPITAEMRSAEGRPGYRLVCSKAATVRRSGGTITLATDETCGAGDTIFTGKTVDVNCGTVELQWSEDGKKRLLQCKSPGTFRGEFEGQTVSGSFVTLSHDAVAATTRMNGKAGKPVETRIVPEKSQARITAAAQAMELVSTGKPGAARQYTIALSGGATAAFRQTGEASGPGMISDIEAPAITIRDSGTSISVNAVSSRLRGSGKAGRFEAEAGKLELVLTRSFAIQQATLAKGVELVSPDGRLESNSAVYTGGIWHMSGGPRPVRFVRDKLALEAGEVVYDPKTGQVIPEGGEFNVAQNSAE